MDNASCPDYNEWPLAYITPVEILPAHDKSPREDPNATFFEKEPSEVTEKTLLKTEEIENQSNRWYRPPS